MAIPCDRLSIRVLSRRGLPTASSPRQAVALLLYVLGLLPPTLRAQRPDTLPAADSIPTGFEIAGVPAVNYNSDEGFGFGVLLELYEYGDGGFQPYFYTLQPTLFFTTGGRREVKLFFDSPHLLPRGWRVSAQASWERHVFSPFYGPGNDAPFDPDLESGENPNYYRFGREIAWGAVNLQRDITRFPLRLLVGLGFSNTSVDPVPENEGTTLLSELLSGGPPPEGWANVIRGGLIWDSRDREVGPNRGAWSEALVTRATSLLGSDFEYTRWSLIDRRYFPLGTRLTVANRIMLHHVEGEIPFFNQYLLPSSFKQEEGLGGSKSLRGVLRNRYFGKGVFLWNLEPRWRAGSVDVAGRRLDLILSAFLDTGRVWEEGVELSGLFSDLHFGYGGGIRVAKGENFVVALDLGTGEETTAQVYIGVGYLF
jgi:hypothetical protein